MDELPPDQRAALSLLLRQHKSYAQVATLLGIAELAVHDRAHAALAVLAPRRARELSPERRLEIGDYLLGQQPGVAERLRTRTYLSTSEPARAWASEIAAQLAPLAGADLPEIPAAAASAATGASAPGPQRVGDLSSSSPPPPAVAGAPGASAPARSLPSSRVGGAVLLAVLAAAVIVAVVLLTGASSSKKTPTTAPTTSSATKTGPTIDDTITFKQPPNARSKIQGVAYVLAEGSTRAFFIEVENLPAAKGFYYAIWLYNSPTSFMGLSKSAAVGSNHRLEGGSRLPSNAGEFHEVLLTRETSKAPRRPGHVLLRGPFKL
ncbi:MAG: sigma-70 region 4 domain-containing protein [Solirubrobacteraceae bacterium]